MKYNKNMKSFLKSKLKLIYFLAAIVMVLVVFAYVFFLRPVKVSLDYRDGNHETLKVCLKDVDEIVLSQKAGYCWSANKDYPTVLDLKDIGNDVTLYQILDIDKICFDRVDDEIYFSILGGGIINRKIEDSNIYVKDNALYQKEIILVDFADLVNQDVEVTYQLEKNNIVCRYQDDETIILDLYDLIEAQNKEVDLYIRDTDLLFSNDDLLVDLDMFALQENLQYYIKDGYLCYHSLDSDADGEIIDLTFISNQDIQYYNGDYVYYVNDNLKYLWKIDSLKSDTKVNNKFYRDLTIEKMNQLAQDIGAKDTLFNTPSGYDETIMNNTTAKDLVSLVLYASKNEILNQAWSLAKYTVDKSVFKRDLTVHSSIFYDDEVNNLANYYTIIAGKTGSWVATRHSLGAIVLDEKTNKKYIVFSSTCYDDLHKIDRYSAAKALVDIAIYLQENSLSHITDSNQIRDEKIRKHVKKLEKEIEYMRNGCVVLYPDADFDISKLFESNYYIYGKNDDEKIQSFSMSKIADVLVSTDYINDTKTKITLVKDDMVEGSGPKFKVGDTLTYQDALRVIMLPSSNTMAHGLARYTGMAILHQKQAISQYESILRYHW